jgi:hypothetical protein
MSGNDPLEEALAAAGLNTVAGAFAYGGGQDLTKPSLGSRRRTRIELTDRTGRHHVLFLKRYGPEGLLARLRRYSRLDAGRCPRVPACQGRAG